MLKFKTLVAGAALAAASITAFAQPGQYTPGIDARQANQQARIEEGRADGTLSKREARRLEQQQREIRRYERRARADGVVTREERRILREMQREAGRNIRIERR